MKRNLHGTRKPFLPAAKLAALAALLACYTTARAQAPAPAASGLSRPSQGSDPGQTRGLVAHVTFEGSSSKDGQVMDLNTSTGYNFNRFFGVDVGMPFYFVRTSSSVSAQNPSGAGGVGIGDVYTDARLAFPSKLLSYSTSFTLTAPTGDQNSGRSTGHWTWSWGNHVEHAVSRFTPYLDAGIGNTVADTRVFKRPFTTFGHAAQLEAGTSVDIWGPFSVSASLYDVLPWGNQQVFSRVVRCKSASSGSSAACPNVPAGPGVTVTRRGDFERINVVSGGPELARDNGYSAALDISATKFLGFELGYTHSVPLKLDTISFSVSLDLSPVFHRNRPR